jgi:hypothetical protein
MGQLMGSWLQKQGLTNTDWLIETGTLNGKGTARAAMFYKFVHTIELEPRYYVQALPRLAKLPNVALHLGDSRTMLPRIIDPAISTTFWLDAHYDGVGDGKRPEDEGSDGPLLTELEIIFSAAWSAPYNIVIDDGEKFDPAWWKYEPSRKHNRAFWPDGRRIRARVAQAGLKLEEIKMPNGCATWVIRSKGL